MLSDCFSDLLSYAMVMTWYREHADALATFLLLVAFLSVVGESLVGSRFADTTERFGDRSSKR